MRSNRWLAGPALDLRFALLGVPVAPMAGATGISGLHGPLEGLGDVEAVFSLLALAWLLILGLLTCRAIANLRRVASVRHERRKDMLQVIDQAEGNS
jgi:hypothetical protein